MADPPCTWLRPGAVLPAARATVGPFATLAAIIGAAALVARLGVFALLARALIPRRPPRAAAAAVLAFTALLSALVNLDVAVVVATPVALRARPAPLQNSARGLWPAAWPARHIGQDRGSWLFVCST